MHLFVLKIIFGESHNKMKFRFFITLLISQMCLSQVCSCKSKPLLDEVISCEKKVFKNGAQVYRQFNCDSSWVVFKGKGKKEKILYVLNDLVELSERLGYVNWTEYNTTFLIENRLISGCCDPSDFILFDKGTGDLKTDLGPLIFYSEDMKYPYVVSLDEDYNSLSLLNINTNKEFKYELPKGVVDKTMEIGNELFPEHLFYDEAINDGVFEVQFRYKLKDEGEENDNWITEKITVDLKKK